jgi:pimeloyl-ACP methyl ester carboxylesterase
MKRLIAASLVSGVLLLITGCGNSGYGTTTGQADLTSYNGNPGSATPSCINPARPANTALYCPAAGILPYPFDVYFANSTDGTLNIQPPNATWPNQPFLNDVDGFSTNAVIRERFNGKIDAASLATPGAVVMIHINTNNAGPQAKAPVSPAAGGAFDPLTGCVVGGASCTSADYSVGVAADDPTVLEITPLHPLRASTCLPTPPAMTSPCQTMANGGNGEAYLVLLTKAITVGGLAAAPDVDYANFQKALASGGSTCPSITDLTLNPLCRLTGAHLGLAQLYAQAVPSFNPANVVASFSFSTESTIDTLVEMSLAANPSGQVIEAYHPPGFTTAAIPNLNLPGHADIYIGVLSIPYYLGTPAQGATAPVTTWWQAPPVVLVPNSPASTNVTRFNPLPVATEAHLLIPLLVSVPNASSAYAKAGGPLPRPGGWPVVIFQHGITRNREDMFGVGDSFADAGFVIAAIDLPFHGVTNTMDPLYASAANPLYKPLNLLPANQMSIERTFDLELITPGTIDPSGSHAINLTSPLTTRDALREGAIDLVMFSRLLPQLNLGSGGTIDATHIHYLGHSLGAMEGTVFLGVVGPGVDTATLANPGGRLTEILTTSPSFMPKVNAGLEAQGVIPGTTLYANFFRDIQTLWDAGDPNNYIALATAQHPIHLLQVVGSTPPPANCTPSAPPPTTCPDQVVPNPTTQNMITASAYGPGGAATALTRIPAPGGPPLAPGPVMNAAGFHAYLNFTQGDHGSIIDNKVPSVTAEMQIEAISFVGSPIPPNPANPLFPGCPASTPGTLICIFDPLVIQGP